jgi:hypothetical protein
MKLILSLLALMGLAMVTTAPAEEKTQTYYVQLIRCSDLDASPQAGSRRIGPKLAERFQCVFRCKSYWEINQERIEISSKHTARAHLSNGRDVEIDLTQPGKRRVSTYYQGRLLDRTVEPVSENMTLIGGDRDQTSHWFIVVRRDKPSQ